MQFANQELIAINDAFRDVMRAAPRFIHDKGRHVIADFATWYQAHPGASDREIAEYLGTSHDVATALKARAPGYFPAAKGMNLQTVIAYLNSTQPHLPLNQPVKPAGFDALVFTLMAFVVIIVAGRLYSRHTIMGGLLLADWAILAGTIITIAFNWLTWINYTFFISALGYWDQTPYIENESNKYTFALWHISLFMLLCIKTSILLFYYELTCWRPVRVAVIITFATTSMSTMTGFLGFTFTCQPVLWWTAAFPKCFEYGGLFLVAAHITNVVTDFALWVIPLPLLFKLNIPPKDRNWAVLIFGLGLVSCIAGGIKVYTINEGGWIGASTLEGRFGGLLTLVANLESQLGIICASIPAWRPLARRYAPRLVSNIADAVDGGIVIPKTVIDIESGGGIDTCNRNAPSNASSANVLAMGRFEGQESASDSGRTSPS